MKPLTSPILPEIVCRLLFGKRPTNRNELLRQRENWQSELKEWLQGIGHFREDNSDDDDYGDRNADEAGTTGVPGGRNDAQNKDAEDQDFEMEEVYDDDHLYHAYEDWEENGINPLSKTGFFGVKPTMRLRVSHK